jgi:hypothetical protein
VDRHEIWINSEDKIKLEGLTLSACNRTYNYYI